MSVAAVGSILRVPADLIWNPTTFPGGSSPYGGTYLGLARDKEFIPEPQLRPVWGEVLGTWKDVFYCGEKVRLDAVLRYPDTDAITTIAFKAFAPGSSGTNFLFRPGGTTANTRAGTSLYASAGVLLLAARANVDHPFVIMYKAIPVISSEALLRFSMGEEWGLKVSFYGSIDTSGRNYAHGRRANLTL